MASSVQSYGKNAITRAAMPEVAVCSNKPRKVAAVCFRQVDGEVEFLLVKTNSGRWTFPKGSVEPGLSESASAELEAFEEAGVMGKVEDEHFDTYLHLRGSREMRIKAFLLAVTKIGRPLENHRNPEWCSMEQARKKLARGRSGIYLAEVWRVLGRAQKHITHEPINRRMIS